MAKRYRAHSGNRVATVRFDNEAEEFRVRLFVDGAHVKAADYFTSDLDDAIGTANAMVQQPRQETRQDRARARQHRQVRNREADLVDGFDRDDLGESPDF